MIAIFCFASVMGILANIVILIKERNVHGVIGWVGFLIFFVFTIILAGEK